MVNHPNRSLGKSNETKLTKLARRQALIIESVRGISNDCIANDRSSFPLIQALTSMQRAEALLLEARDHVNRNA